MNDDKKKDVIRFAFQHGMKLMALFKRQDVPCSEGTFMGLLYLAALMGRVHKLVPDERMFLGCAALMWRSINEASWKTSETIDA